ncbi:MAG: Maf family protein, partial [Pseudomonadota bacterium]|nr:Maf family protein [Pseudomonadota bacterium]
MNPPLILASSSPYRRELLAKLGLTFTWQSPDIDESPTPGEPPEALVARLAREKALAIAHHHDAALIITSDQVAVLNGQI